MVFSSSLFLLYFLPVFLLFYYFADVKYKNYVALIGSIFFYAWGAPRFIFVILGTTFLDFHLVKWMSMTKSQLNRRLMLTLSVSVNLGLLFYFKYSNFFVENINAVLSVFGTSNSIHWTKLILPIGISFYTFETITYVVDVYRRVHKPLTNFWDYQLYIILFPKLIAGPIIRYHDLADQITDRSRNDTIDNKISGFFRFALGLGKKVLIANVLGEYADSVFAMNPSGITTATAWMGIIAYAFQIFYDFAGYSDMAIGLGRMIGFDFLENFNNPYISQNISEFWRRWHMSLGRWMRDYLYIPLGGNRVSAKRLYFNLWLVFLFSGLWHGAAWNFVVWGGFHGFFLVADRLFLMKFYKLIGKYPSIIITFVITLVGWVLFRSESLDYAIDFIARMFSFSGGPAIYISRKVWVILIVGAFFGFWGAFGKNEKWQEKLLGKNQKLSTLTLMTAASVILFIISVASISSSGFNPFIYFRF
ncbi:MAG: MBOAT family protein [Bacteroidales bacterium]|nr:MBOAT family protein [Bacteroidales bacterium]